MTLNNLANLYLKLNDYDKSLEYLLEVLSFNFPGAKTSLAITYINIAVIKSHLGDHEAALDHLSKAIAILKDSAEMTPNIKNSLIIAYHNFALEHKFLGRQKELHKYMREAWESSLEQLGPDHILTHTIFQQLSETMAESNFSHIKIRNNLPIKIIAKGEKKLEKILGKKTRAQPNETAEFQQIRFLTGERLQPMYKTRIYKKLSTRPGSRALSTRGERKLMSSKVMDESKTDNAESLTNLARIGEHINHLQAKIDIFEEKCIDLKVLTEEPEDPISSKNSPFEKSEDKKVDFKALEDLRNKAVIEIQRRLKGWKTRQNLQRKHQKTVQAAKTIARAFKGFLSKEILKLQNNIIDTIPEETEEQENDSELNLVKKDSIGVYKNNENNVKYRSFDENVILIQSHIRKFQARKKYLRTRDLAIKIQSAVRMWEVKRIYKSIYEAVVYIQAYYRGHKVRKNLLQTL
jgi:Tetratricopeptide repeat/IQ calmodulin-binding motif